MKKNIVLLAGDGIGPDVARPVGQISQRGWQANESTFNVRVPDSRFFCGRRAKCELFQLDLVRKGV